MLEHIVKALRERKNDDKLVVTAETVLADLALDSLDMVELLMELEDEFSVTIDSDASIQTVGDLISQISAKIS